MSNEKNFTSMKIYLKKLGKLFFWNSLSAAILGGDIFFMEWLFRLMQGMEYNSSGAEHGTVGYLFFSLLLGVLFLVTIVGNIFFVFWCYVRSAKMWYKHPDKKQKVLLGLSDLIVGIGCSIVVLCYFSQYSAIAFLLLIAPLAFLINKTHYLFTCLKYKFYKKILTEIRWISSTKKAWCSWIKSVGLLPLYTDYQIW